MKHSDILALVQRPSRYLGTEINSRHKEWNEAELKVGLVFPDLYEIGMSHLGLHILYHIINDLDWALADRAYCPDRDLEGLLEERGLELWGLESGRPLSAFDLLAFTIPYELCYTNIVTILKFSGIPLLSQERNDPKWPVILGGGSGAFNAEPVADIFDAILIGDGEEAIVEIAEVVRQWRRGKGTKEELLRRLSAVPGVYIPSFYRPIYENDGSFKELEPRQGAPLKIRRRIVSDFNAMPFPERPLVPYMQTVHDRLGVEIARGCTRGCRFCQAGIIYRPVRERAPERILSIIEKALAASGWDELSLLSLSTGDYSCLTPLLKELMDRYVPKNIAVSLPSLRVGTLTPEIISQIRRVRKTGFTLAPEAGSERLRRVINKGITEEDLLETAQQAYEAGWNLIKLYFMIGLPTETIEDVEAINELARKVLKVRPRSSRGKRTKGQVTVSVGTFVPKPHTAFQWERQISVSESRQRIEFLKSLTRGRDIKLKWHDPIQSFLEGVFSRGDRKLVNLIIKAWEMGARLDAWSDHLRFDIYKKAAEAEGIALETYLGARDQDGIMPWDHIDTGVKREFLIGERNRAWDMTYTPDCRKGTCQGCGVCDFKKVRPVTFRMKDQALSLNRSVLPSQNRSKGKGEATTFAYAFSYTKLNEARFLSHLETVRAFHRAASRASIPVCFSQGFHPMPKFSFQNPIPLGQESLGEQAVVTLKEPVVPRVLMEKLNNQLPEGLKVISVEMVHGKRGFKKENKKCYYVHVPSKDESSVQKALDEYHDREHWPLVVERKGKSFGLDLKEGVIKIDLVDWSRLPENIREVWGVSGSGPLDIEGRFVLELELVEIGRAVQPEDGTPANDKKIWLRPESVVAPIVGLSREEMTLLRVLKRTCKN